MSAPPPKIKVRILREIGYDSPFNRIVYRATLRLMLVQGNRPPKDLAPLINLTAESPEGLESKISNAKETFKELLRSQPEFVKKIRQPEESEIG